MLNKAVMLFKVTKPANVGADATLGIYADESLFDGRHATIIVRPANVGGRTISVEEPGEHFLAFDWSIDSEFLVYIDSPLLDEQFTVEEILVRDFKGEPFVVDGAPVGEYEISDIYSLKAYDTALIRVEYSKEYDVTIGEYVVNLPYLLVRA